MKKKITAGSSRKCEKSNHKWYDCYSKEAVKTRVAGFKKAGKEKPNSRISAVQTTETEQRIDEIVDPDMEILDYGID